MKIYFLAATILFVVCQQNAEAQEISGGAIKYETYTNFDLSYFKDADPKIKEWLAGMPKGLRSAKILYFTAEESLHKEDPNAEIVPDKKVSLMLMKMAYIQPPAPKLQKVFFEIVKGEQTKLPELMSRYFCLQFWLPCC